MYLLLLMCLVLLLLSQKKQFEFRLKKEQSQSQHWQSLFQDLREEFVLESQKVVGLETRLAQVMEKVQVSDSERAKALEWDLQ
jgi:hypothetical protein